MRMNRGRGCPWRAAQGLGTRRGAAHGSITGLRVEPQYSTNHESTGRLLPRNTQPKPGPWPLVVYQGRTPETKGKGTMGGRRGCGVKGEKGDAGREVGDTSLLQEFLFRRYRSRGV